MKKQVSAEKKAKRPARTARPREELEAPNLRMENLPHSGNADYREILLEIKKELKELRSILEG